MTSLTREEHAAMRSRYQPKPGEGLADYSERCNKQKAAIWTELESRFPTSVIQDTLSNSRFEVHLESVLRAGGSVSPDILKTVSRDRELRYDAGAFPLLTQLIQ